VLESRNVVGLRLDRYDRTRPLVIDPILVYCTYLGGSGADQINAVQMDSHGHLYVAGSTTTADLLAGTSETWGGTAKIALAPESGRLFKLAELRTVGTPATDRTPGTEPTPKK
jgi:hypothetical protein